MLVEFPLKLENNYKIIYTPKDNIEKHLIIIFKTFQNKSEWREEHIIMKQREYKE